MNYNNTEPSTQQWLKMNKLHTCLVAIGKNFTVRAMVKGVQGLAQHVFSWVTQNVFNTRKVKNANFESHRRSWSFRNYSRLGLRKILHSQKILWIHFLLNYEHSSTQYRLYPTESSCEKYHCILAYLHLYDNIYVKFPYPSSQYMKFRSRVWWLEKVHRSRGTSNVGVNIKGTPIPTKHKLALLSPPAPANVFIHPIQCTT